MCCMSWPPSLSVMNLPYIAFTLDNKTRDICAKPNINGDGQNFKGRVLTKENDGEMIDSNFDIVIWGPNALRRSLKMGVPYVAMDARYKEGE